MILDITHYEGKAIFKYFKEFDDGLLSKWLEYDKDSNQFISLFSNWLYHWWLNYKNENITLIIFAVYIDNQLKCVIPLMCKDKVLMFLSDNCSDYLGVNYNKEIEYELNVLFDYIFSNLDYDEVLFKNIREDMPFYDFIIDFSKKHFDDILIQKTDLSYYINIHQEWDMFFNESLSLNLKNRIKKSLRKLDKDSLQYTFEVHQNYSKDLLDNIFEIHKKNWSNNFEVSVFYDHRRVSFTDEICKYFASENRLLLFIIKIEKEIVAYRFGFVINNTYQDWNTSFSIEFSKYSVGNILIYESLKYLFKAKFNEFNFMRGNEDYKVRWTKAYRSSYSISLKRKLLPSLFLRRKNEQYLKPLKGFIFDLDGVVYKDEVPIEDTIYGINKLYEQGYKIGFLTNTSSKHENEINTKLINLGIDFTENIIMTSSIATVDFLKENNFKSCYLFGGGEALEKLILQNNISIVNDTENIPDSVLIGYAKNFSYDILLKVVSLMDKGVPLICTDKDYMFSYNNTNLPGTGWYIEAIEKVSGKKGVVIGKPNTYSLSKTLQKMNLSPNQTIMIGDNLHTDILSAKRLGMPSCLLLGGISTVEDVAKTPNESRPEFVVNSLSEIINILNISVK